MEVAGAPMLLAARGAVGSFPMTSDVPLKGRGAIQRETPNIGEERVLFSLSCSPLALTIYCKLQAAHEVRTRTAIDAGARARAATVLHCVAQREGARRVAVSHRTLDTAREPE